MFLVIRFNDTTMKEIVYIQNDNPETVREAAESYCGPYEAYLYGDNLYDWLDIQDDFEDNKRCINADGEFDWDLVRAQLDKGRLSLGNVESFGWIEIIDSDHFTIDEDGDI